MISFSGVLSERAKLCFSTFSTLSFFRNTFLQQIKKRQSINKLSNFLVIQNNRHVFLIKLIGKSIKFLQMEFIQSFFNDKDLKESLNPLFYADKSSNNSKTLKQFYDQSITQKYKINKQIITHFIKTSNNSINSFLFMSENSRLKIL
ncbi:hypothetical protein ABPG74_006193 [Tetrahymena malaccensis]